MNIQSKFVALIVVIFGHLTAQAASMPPNWPWHGISIENSDFNPDRLPEVLAHIHINSVQLRLNPRNLAKVEGISVQQAWADTLSWADQMLDQCAHLGIGAIVTLEGFPIDPKAPYIATSPNFWRNGKDINEIAALAGKLAKHFSKRGKELLAYQMISEPVMLLNGEAVIPPNWPSLESRIINNIRKYDPGRWVAVAPAPWGLPGSYRKFSPLPYARIVYGAHMYEPRAFTHQGIYQFYKTYTYPGEIDGRFWDRDSLRTVLQPLRDFQMRYQVPVWIGEFSAIRWAPGGDRYIRDLASIFNQYGWSWTYFSLDGWFGWNPNYDNRKPEPMSTWRSHRVGYDSDRWQTLEAIFNGPG